MKIKGNLVNFYSVENDEEQSDSDCSRANDADDGERKGENQVTADNSHGHKEESASPRR